MFTAQLLSLVGLAAAANAYWSFGGLRPIVTTRLDPIISPGVVSSHVHSVVGGSRFKSVYQSDDLLQSNCSTVPVQPDKSNYWAPQLYHQDQQTGRFTPVPTQFSIYYLLRYGPKNETIKAFPPGLRMLAGDTNRRSFNSSSFADKAIDFVCLDLSGAHADDPDWAERPSFFEHNCPDGMRAQVFFPSCWDGVNLDSSDHKSHMAYPIQDFNEGDCPESHPVHFVSLFYEMIVSVDEFDYWGPGTWVLANGDTTGYGHHGDFQNGWDVDLLQNAIDDCADVDGNVLDCPPLAAVYDRASADACVLETQIVDEDTGFDSPISSLPGCNLPWDGTGPRPTCPSGPAPVIVPVTTTLPTNWTEIGCAAEGPTGRALIGASTTSPNMTRASCAAFCQEKGFALAGAEYSDECYCDNELRNGASNTTVTWNECSNHCAGNDQEICGGPNRLTLMFTSSPPTLPSQHVPPGWTNIGCVSDNGARALTGYNFASDQMTITSCTSACASRNFTLAGIEYGSECYCGSSFMNGAGNPLDAVSCNMVCSGDSSTTCGGSWTLSAFRSNSSGVATTSSSSPSPPTGTASSSATVTFASSSDAASSSLTVSVSSSSPSSASGTSSLIDTSTHISASTPAGESSTLAPSSSASSDSSPSTAPASTPVVGRRGYRPRGNAITGRL